MPALDDLYRQDYHAEALLRSLLRAQLGVTLSVLLPAGALVAIYPLLAVLLPWVATARVGLVPVSALVLGFGIYPPLVGLGFWYVRRAQRLEQRFRDVLEDH